MSRGMIGTRRGSEVVRCRWRRPRGSFALVGLVALVALPTLLVGQEARRSERPDQARLVTEDIPRFWEAFDAAAPDFAPDAFRELYLDRASPGLEDFVQARIGNADELAAVVRSHPGTYAAMRSSSLQVASREPEIRAGFEALEALYPEAVFPDVYFLIGRMSSGGTVSPRGLLIGTEMYGLTDETPMEELGDWHRQVLRGIDVLPHIVLHELIHFQQSSPDTGPPTLLAVAIGEGVADFLSEKIGGRHINEHIHAWAAPREAELWDEFRERMHGSDLTGWLYDGDGARGRPADLGYWMGYRIAASYWETVDDPAAAIRGLLHIDDHDAFLARSGYAERMAGGDR